MKCKRCMTVLNEEDLFCPMCGLRVTPPQDDDEPQDAYAVAEALDASLTASNSSSDGSEDFRSIAEQLDYMDTQRTETVRLTPDKAASYPGDQPSAQPYGPVGTEYRAPAPYPQQQGAYVYPNAYPYMNQGQPFAGHDNPTAREGVADEDFGDGYVDQPAQPSAGKYRRTTAGKRTGSIFLCILMALMLLFTVVNLSLRMTFTDSNIRSATDSEKLIDRTLIADTGETTAVNYLRTLIGSDKLAAYPASDEILTRILRGGRISSLTSAIISDYAKYLFSDKEPAHLNAAYITGELERFNSELSVMLGEAVEAFDTQRIAERINGGDLSFLSIDDEGGWFYRHYDLNPKLPATAFSLPILIICGVIALLCIVMIFVINSANLPAGLSFYGVVLILIGCFCALTAIGCIVLTFIKEIWILTDLLRQAALWTGVFGAALLTLGVTMTAVAGSLRKKAKRAELSEISAL